MLRVRVLLGCKCMQCIGVAVGYVGSIGMVVGRVQCIGMVVGYVGSIWMVVARV